MNIINKVWLSIVLALFASVIFADGDRAFASSANKSFLEILLICIPCFLDFMLEEYNMV